MNEAFLHYVWKYRLFSDKNLKTSDGQRIEVVRPGMHNMDSGPDFFDARLRIDGKLWAGNVEIHMRSSDWLKHNHQHDAAYDSCLLHVVYENDAVTLRMNGDTIPTLELKGRFSSSLWENYLNLIGSQGWIPCQGYIKDIDEATWSRTKEQCLTERLQQRTRQVIDLLRGNKGDWEVSLYQQLARNFGFRLNAMPFEMLARSLPLRIVRREADRTLHTEALLFGQSGMLEAEHADEYFQSLQRIYTHLAKKYSLVPIPFSAWKFLRLRPVNFPAVRIAQFAVLLQQVPSFMQFLMENDLPGRLAGMNICAGDYWHTHYHFGKESVASSKTLGLSSKQNLVINSFIPFLYAWGKHAGSEEHCRRAAEFLQQLPGEENSIMVRWRELGLAVRSAADSQALIHLKTMHCSEKKCLTCRVGNKIINSML